MAAPNLANVSSIIGSAVGVALTTTTTTSLLANAASSGAVVKVNGITVTNISGSSATVTLDFHNGSTAYGLAYTLTVPVGATVVVLDKNAYLYLAENCSIKGGASADSRLEAVITYETMS